MHDSGAEFADDNPGRLVGPPNGVGHRLAGGEHHRQDGNDRVPSTADVEHFAREGRNMQTLPPALQGHAFFAARNQQGVEIEALAKLLRALR